MGETTLVLPTSNTLEEEERRSKEKGRGGTEKTKRERRTMGDG